MNIAADSRTHNIVTAANKLDIPIISATYNYLDIATDMRAQIIVNASNNITSFNSQ